MKLGLEGLLHAPRIGRRADLRWASPGEGKCCVSVSEKLTREIDHGAGV